MNLKYYHLILPNLLHYHQFLQYHQFHHKFDIHLWFLLFLLLHQFWFDYILDLIHHYHHFFHYCLNQHHQHPLGHRAASDSGPVGVFLHRRGQVNSVEPEALPRINLLDRLALLRRLLPVADGHRQQDDMTGVVIKVLSSLHCSLDSRRTHETLPKHVTRSVSEGVLLKNVTRSVSDGVRLKNVTRSVSEGVRRRISRRF